MALVPHDVLHASPSRVAGIAEEVEERYRVFACELAQEAGILLKQPQEVSATAQTFVQRFLYRESLTNVDAHLVAMVAVFVASKVEEAGRKAGDVINVFHHLKMKREGVEDAAPMKPTSAEFASWKAALLHTEACMLKELGFSLYALTHHPHRFLPYFVRVLGGSPALAQKAWCFLNDSLRLDLCARHLPETIACAAIYMAARETSTPLPSEPSWLTLFSPTSSLAELQGIAARVLQLYTRPKLGWLPSLRVAPTAA